VGYLVGSDGEVLLAAEQLRGSALRGVAVDGCGLVLEVEDEPKLDARVGHDDVDPVPAGEVEHFGNVRMDVTVGCAPHLVVGATSATGRVALRLLLGCDRPFDEGGRRATSGVDGDENVVSQAAPERKEVPVLRPRAVGSLTSR